MNFIEPAVALAVGYPICVASTLWMFTKGTRWHARQENEKIDTDGVMSMIIASFIFPLSIPFFLFVMVGKWFSLRNKGVSFTQRLRNYINEGL